jgi:hypothetical protein
MSNEDIMYAMTEHSYYLLHFSQVGSSTHDTQCHPLHLFSFYTIDTFIHHSFIHSFINTR